MSECQYFDVDVAKDVGVNAAIIFKSFCFWIQKNASEKENFKDGDYWTYASAKGLETYFPYFTARQISYAIDQLVEKKYLKKAQLCDNKTNRTMWYALDENGKCIFQIRQMHSTNLSNGSNKNVKSNIEDREKKIEKEDISSSLRSEDKAQKRFNPRKALFDEGVAGQVISDWLAMRKQLKAVVTQTAIDRIRNEAIKANISLEDAMRIMCANGWRGFQAEWIQRSKPQQSVYEQTMDAAQRAKAMIFGDSYATE